MLSSRIDDESPLTFFIQSDGSGAVAIDPSSSDETLLLAVMDDWVERNFSSDEVDQIGLGLEALLQDASSAPELSMDEL